MYKSSESSFEGSALGSSRGTRRSDNNMLNLVIIMSKHLIAARIPSFVLLYKQNITIPRLVLYDKWLNFLNYILLTVSQTKALASLILLRKIFSSSATRGLTLLLSCVLATRGSTSKFCWGPWGCPITSEWGCPITSELDNITFAAIILTNLSKKRRKKLWTSVSFQETTKFVVSTQKKRKKGKLAQNLPLHRENSSGSSGELKELNITTGSNNLVFHQAQITLK